MTTPPVDPNRIVVGVDGSTSSDDALRWGRFVAESIGGALQAVFAWPSMPSGPPPGWRMAEWTRGGWTPARAPPGSWTRPWTASSGMTARPSCRPPWPTWGTPPGRNFSYVHLNRAIKKYHLGRFYIAFYIAGPGRTRERRFLDAFFLHWREGAPVPGTGCALRRSTRGSTCTSPVAPLHPSSGRRLLPRAPPGNRRPPHCVARRRT